MARRRQKRTSSHSHINKCLSVDLAAGDNYIDLAQLMSQSNRQTYTSGAYYTLKSINANTSAAALTISATPTGWLVAKAYKHARKGWASWRKKMGLTKHKWARFRPALEHDQFAASTFSGNVALAGDGYTNVAGTYDPSEVEYEDPSSGTHYRLMFHMNGDHDTGVPKAMGMLTELSQYRLKAQAPEPATDADEQMLPLTRDVGPHPMDAAVEENIEPPYAAETYPGEGGVVPVWTYTYGPGSNASQGINMKIAMGIMKVHSSVPVSDVCIKVGKIEKF